MNGANSQEIPTYHVLTGGGHRDSYSWLRTVMTSDSLPIGPGRVGDNDGGPHRHRPFLGQNADRGRVAVACAGPLHILCQQSRRIPLAHIDDAALRQICI